jgi:MoxR-like ATPase
MRIEMGFPSEESEVQLLQNQNEQQIVEVQRCYNQEDLLMFQSQCQQVFCHKEIAKYVRQLLQKSRENAFYSPLSPRSGVALIRVAQAWAFLQDRKNIIPDDVLEVLPWVWGHRLHFHKKGSVQESYHWVNEFRQGVRLP